MSRPSLYLGHRIQNARLSAGISREQLAITVGRSWTTIRSYELGASTPTIDGLARLADAMGVSVADLFVDVDEQVSA